MNNQSYCKQITTSASPLTVFQAVTINFDKWWTPGSQPVINIGDQVTFQFEPTYWVMQATKLEPNELVEYECIESRHYHEGLPDSILEEWKGTKLRWNIERAKGITTVKFIHEGLIPSLDCYDICEGGWDYFFVESLKKYLDQVESNNNVVTE